MSGWVAGASLGGAALSTLGSLYSASQKQGSEGNQLLMAQQNYMLQKQAMEQQQRMAEAGRMDSAGNRVYFNGKDWVTDTTDATKGIISSSQANEREQNVVGGTRRELGQRNNFESRGQAGNEADATLRLMRDRIGAPTLEGTRGRNAVAAATEIGSNRDTLVDAVSRNLIRSGGSTNVGERAIDSIGEASGRNLRTALAKNDTSAPELNRVATEGWQTGLANKYNPLNAVRSNLTDMPMAPTQVGAPIDASLNQAATYGAATSGKGATALNQAGALVGGAAPKTDMPWGSSIYSLTEAMKAYIGSKDKGNGTPWNEDSRNDAAYNSWRF